MQKLVLLEYEERRLRQRVCSEGSWRANASCLSALARAASELNMWQCNCCSPPPSNRRISANIQRLRCKRRHREWADVLRCGAHSFHRRAAIGMDGPAQGCKLLAFCDVGQGWQRHSVFPVERRYFSGTLPAAHAAASTNAAPHPSLMQGCDCTATSPAVTPPPPFLPAKHSARKGPLSTSRRRSALHTASSSRCSGLTPASAPLSCGMCSGAAPRYGPARLISTAVAPCAHWRSLLKSTLLSRECALAACAFTTLGLTGAAARVN